MVADGAAGGRPVLIALSVRRFRCPEPSCPRATFAEQAGACRSGTGGAACRCWACWPASAWSWPGGPPPGWRFTAYRDALGLPRALTVHSERHAYVTHLTEDGADRRFIQEQVGHECDSSTAVYTHVSDDFMNTALSRALAPVFAGADE